MKHNHGLILLLLISTLISCTVNDRTESDLQPDEIQFIKDLGLLENGESIEMFESNGGMKGYKQSGNLITDKRIASYWLEDNKDELYSAFYSEIDSIAETDLISKLTYASYLTVFKSDGTNFKVYVDADSLRTYTFFEKAKQNLKK